MTLQMLIVLTIILKDENEKITINRSNDCSYDDISEC